MHTFNHVDLKIVATTMSSWKSYPRQHCISILCYLKLNGGSFASCYGATAVTCFLCCWPTRLHPHYAALSLDLSPCGSRINLACQEPWVKEAIPEQNIFCMQEHTRRHLTYTVHSSLKLAQFTSTIPHSVDVSQLVKSYLP